MREKEKEKERRECASMLLSYIINALVLIIGKGRSGYDGDDRMDRNDPIGS